MNRGQSGRIPLNSKLWRRQITPVSFKRCLVHKENETVEGLFGLHFEDKIHLRNVDVSLFQRIDDETEDLLAILLLLLLLKIYFYDIISKSITYFLYRFLLLYYTT